MSTLLQLNTSLFLTDGQSTRLADAFVAAWRASHQDAQVVVRDLAAQPLPHLDAAAVGAFFTPAAQRTPAQQAVAAESEALIAELQAAEVLVIGLPMYNFGIPSTLKAYFDRIARAGLTFRYTEHGAEGLLANRKVYVFATRGGLFAGTPLDTSTAYIRDFLGFLGLRDVEFVYAEGLNMGDELKTQGLAAAGEKLLELAV